MMLDGDFYWIPILPPEMRRKMNALPMDKRRWPKDFRDRYQALHREFTAAKGEFIRFARRDKDRKMSARAKNALAYLVDCLNFDTGRCDPSQQTIADEIGCHVSTVERVMRRLIDAGWLAASRRGATNTNFYQLRVTKTKIDAIAEDSEARRDLRRSSRRWKSDPAKMTDHQQNHPAEMRDHEPAKMTDHDPAKMRDKPLNRTSEGEPLNENKNNHVQEGTYTREGIPSDDRLFSRWIEDNIPDRSHHREAYRLLREQKMTPELWRRMAA